MEHAAALVAQVGQQEGAVPAQGDAVGSQAQGRVGQNVTLPTVRVDPGDPARPVGDEEAAGPGGKDTFGPLQVRTQKAELPEIDHAVLSPSAKYRPSRSS